jgi:triosephosphate isomerase
VLVGHSERRQYHGETDELVARKALRAQSHNITPIVCMGERLDEREQGRTMTVLAAQVQALVDADVQLVAGQLLFAYEPVWAIGTGVAASPEAITEVHHSLRHLLHGLGGKAAGDIAILYGGSVNPSNANEILSLPGVDGALIGGASLKMDQFLAIAECDTVKSA